MDQNGWKWGGPGKKMGKWWTCWSCWIYMVDLNNNKEDVAHEKSSAIRSEVTILQWNVKPDFMKLSGFLSGDPFADGWWITPICLWKLLVTVQRLLKINPPIFFPIFSHMFPTKDMLSSFSFIFPNWKRKRWENLPPHRGPSKSRSVLAADNLEGSKPGVRSEETWPGNPRGNMGKAEENTWKTMGNPWEIHYEWKFSWEIHRTKWGNVLASLVWLPKGPLAMPWVPKFKASFPHEKTAYMRSLFLGSKALFRTNAEADRTDQRYTSTIWLVRSPARTNGLVTRST